MVLGTTIFSNGKGQVVPNNRNDCGPVKADHLQLKVVLNIPVRLH